MNPTLTIARRELKGYFASPVAFVVIVIFLLFASFCTFKFGHWLERGEANLFWFFFFHPFLYAIFVPSLGMRTWSEERRLGTIELLLTMPVTPWQAIVGKFVASWAVMGIGLALTFPIALTANYLGDPDNGVIAGGYLGSLLMAGAFMAISTLTSAMTRNQVVSFIVALVVCFLLIFAGFPPVTDFFTTWAPVWLVDGIAATSVWTHFESIQKGVLDSRDILYFLSVIAFSLFTTNVIIRAHRAG